MKNTIKMSLAVLGLASIYGTANASVMYDLSNDRTATYDSQWKTYGFYNDGNWYIRAGLGATTIRRAAVYVFQLPTVVDPDLVFTSASLSVQLVSVTGSTSNTTGTNPVPTFNLDLYGSRVSSSATVTSADFYAGGLSSTMTLMQDNFLTSSSVIRTSSTVGFNYTSTDANTVLANFLTASYNKGANAGQYVFLTLAADYTTVTSDMANMCYTVLAGEASGTSEKPQITYTTESIPAPEAASLSILAIGAMGLIGRRRAAR